MRYSVRLIPRANREIREIRIWYRERSGSEEVGNRWVDGLFERLDELEWNPERFPLAGESPFFPYEMRELLYSSGRRITHRVLLRVLKDNVVEVMAIRHFAQQDVTPDDF